jgi:NAD-dependent dihydropyrimidine dehydrogenase PreA subunit
MDVIRFDEETKKAFIKYPEDCIACYNCEMDCPVKAIYVTPQRGIAVTPSW